MIRIILLLFPLSLFAEVVTTTNLISQDFTDGSWNNPVNSWHSSNDLAGWNGLTHSTSVVYENDDLKSGFDMTTGAEIFHWYNNQTVHITQSVTLDDGSVTSQTKSYLASRGTVHDVANTIIIGSNTSADYELGMSILFEDTRGQVGHYSADVRDPYITLTYDNTPPLSQELETEILTTVSDTTNDLILFEYKPEEEFNFESYLESNIEVASIEEINFDPITTQEINIGVVDVFQEITYEEIPTEIKIEEVFETSNFIGEPEGEPIKEIISEPSSSLSSRPKENEESIIKETESIITEDNVPENPSRSKEPTTEDTVVAEEIDDSDREREAGGSEPTDERTEVATSGEETLESRSPSVEDSRTEGTTRVSNQTITVESIEKKVNQTLTRIDQRLVATSLIVARAMESPLSMDNYGNTNNNILINQLNIDGGNYYDSREFIDDRNIYAQSQVMYQDTMSEYNKVVQESIGNRIRAEEHLRSIRGY
jgi:hypothetical protein